MRTIEIKQRQWVNETYDIVVYNDDGAVLENHLDVRGLPLCEKMQAHLQEHFGVAALDVWWL